MRAGGEGATEDEIVGWHPHLNGPESEQTPGEREGQGEPDVLAQHTPWELFCLCDAIIISVLLFVIINALVG